MNWRIEGLRLASRRLVGAYLLDGGKPSVEVDALVGMLILDQQPSSGDGGGPAPVEIVELDTRRGYQRLGVASRLLGIGALLTHPDTPLVLDVAEGNGSAQTFYAARGFRFDPGLRYDHGVYNTLHIGMRTDARTLVQNPRINRGPDLSWGVLPENKAAALP